MRHKKLLDKYIRYVSLNRSTATQEVHREKLRPLLKAWDHLEPQEFTLDEFEEWLAMKLESGWSPRTVRIMLDVSRAFVRWANERDIDMPNYTEGIKKPAVHSKRPESFTREEIQKLLDAAKGHRLEIVVALGALGGFRKTEIQLAQWQDIRWDDHEMTVRGTKTHRDRVLPMGDKLWQVLRSHWRGQKRGPILNYPCYQVNLRRDFIRLCKRAGVDYKSPHKLRHSFLTLMMANGADTATCRDLAGHKSIRTTCRYLTSTPARQKAAVNLVL